MSAEDQLRVQIAQTLAQLDQGDVQAARSKLNALLQAVEAYPQIAGDVHFALGMARLADLSDDEQATSAMDAACKHFQEARKLGLTPSLQPRLAYQMAKVRVLMAPTDDKALADFRTEVDQSPADAVDGLLVLARTYERRGTLDEAVHATDRLLAHASLTNPNPVRLQRGLLLVRMERFVDARLMLERIPASAPEYPQALDVMAQSYHQAEQWSPAAGLWESCLKQKWPPATRSRLQYLLADCYWHLDRRADAARSFAGLIRDFPSSSEALPARLRLADHYLQTGDEEGCKQSLTAAVTGFTPTTRNPYVDCASLGRVVAETWTQCRTQGRYDLALAITPLYQTIGAPGEADRMAGVTYLESAQLLGRSVMGDGQNPDKVRERLMEAGAAFVRAATAKADVQEQANLLWTAADCYLQASAHDQAVLVLERYFSLNVTTPHHLEARLGLGEAYQALKRSADADAILKGLTQEPGVRTRASYLLAQVRLDQNKDDEAEALLRGILAAPAQAVTDKYVGAALDALVYLLFRRERYLDASEVLEQNLARTVTDAIDPTRRFYLARAYGKIARQHEQNVTKADTSVARDYFRSERRRSLENAVRYYQQVSATLTAPRLLNGHGAANRELLRETLFELGDCLEKLGRHDEALAAFDLLTRDQGQEVWHFKALLCVAQVQINQRRAEEARQTLQTVRERFAKLTDQDLEPTHLQRATWESVILASEAAVLNQPSK